MITAVLLALLSASPETGGGPLPAEALGAPPHMNAAPTAWACSVETLKSGRECVFEADVAESTDVQSQAASNIRTLRDVGRALCQQAARPPSGAPVDKNLQAQCERKYAETSEDSCGLEGKVPVIDAKGRFAPAARACYRQLSEVLQDITMMATVASACCQCAEKRGCPGSGERCHENVSHQELGATALACLSTQCGGACGLMMPESTPSARDSRPAKSVRAPSRISRSL